MVCRSGTNTMATVGTCQRYTDCIELLWDYATELGITIEKTADPSKMAEELFVKVKAMI